MALRYNGSPQATSAAHVPAHVTGQYLARAHLNRKQRARIAGDLANGTAAIFPLTIRQAAALARVPVLDVSRTRLNGKPRNGRTNGHAETLAEHIARSSPDRTARGCTNHRSGGIVGFDDLPGRLGRPGIKLKHQRRRSRWASPLLFVSFSGAGRDEIRQVRRKQSGEVKWTVC